MSREFARNIVGGVVLLLAAGIVAGLFLFEIPKGNNEIAFVILGLVMGWVGAVVQFHYGTSEGSKSKTLMLSGKSSAPLDLTGAELP